jgi:hypothetical protein
MAFAIRAHAALVDVRGSVFHEHFDDESAVPFIDDGYLALQVWCKEDAGIVGGEPIRYAAALIASG